MHSEEFVTDAVNLGAVLMVRGLRIGRVDRAPERDNMAGRNANGKQVSCGGRGSATSAQSPGAMSGGRCARGPPVLAEADAPVAQRLHARGPPRDA